MRLPKNEGGRDFVVGDIHGAFAAVHEAMAAVDFDPAQDRLFSVGDLVDRGPESAHCVEFLAQPFVYAVRGNHEHELLKSHGRKGTSATTGEPWLAGAEWWMRASKEERRRVVAALRKLPLAIEVATKRGNVGFFHAEVPIGMDWSIFCARLEAGDEEMTEAALWSRERIECGDTSGVPGIDRLFVGHYVQSGGMKRYGNVYAVDTGAIFSELYGRSELHLTLANVQTSTADLDMPREISRFDVRDGPTPSRPFGRYARK